jgi:hypothetical protein
MQPYNDTALAAGAKAGNLTPASLNYTQDFTKRETKANQAIISNLTSPLDRPETIRFAYQGIADVYKGTGIDPSVYASSRKGFSVLVQVNDTISVVDSDTKKRVDLPISAHLVFKGPQHEAVSGEVIRQLIARVIGALYEEGAATPDARINSLIRGAVLPKALV